MRIIIDIDSGEVASTQTAIVSKKASTEVLAAAAAIGAVDAGPAPAGLINITMEKKERAQDTVLEYVASDKEMALDAGPSPRDLLGLEIDKTQFEAPGKVSSFVEAIDAGKPGSSIMDEVEEGI